MSDRVEKIKKFLKRKKIDAILISDLTNIRYLCGFAGSSAFLLVTKFDAYLFTDFRYFERAEYETTGCKIKMVGKNYARELIKFLSESGSMVLAFEKHNLNYANFFEFKNKQFEMIPVENIVEKNRAIKDAVEIESIIKACEITTKTMNYIVGILTPGVKERTVAMEAEYFMRKNGADEAAFDSIIAAGPNSAIPHAATGERIVKQGDIVICDIGARFNGYCADMTRTFSIGKATAFQNEIYEIVRKAHRAALDSKIWQKTAKDVDSVARGIINAAGYGKLFGHGLGHGIGLEAHEQPGVSRKSNVKMKPGMVFTIEPGIYLRGQFGVRIEDTVLLNDGKIVYLTNFSRKLIEI